MFAISSLVRRIPPIAFVLLLPCLAVARPARNLPQPVPGSTMIRGGAASAVKAVVDTLLLMGPRGSGAPYVGTFEDAGGGAAWNGWTHRDLSAPAFDPWHADVYHAVSGLYSAWCGEARFAACDLDDAAGGYGNNYDAVLEWRGTVADPGQPCTVDVAAVANIDVEPGYDYVHVQVETASGVIDLLTEDGSHPGFVIDESHVYQPGTYAGAGGDEVVVRFRVASDEIWSDEDCLWRTAGAMQLDDVVITLSNGAGTSHDFEDGTLGPFSPVAQARVGDFTQIWSGLEDMDPCATNDSPQVAFIDDGVVVPGTGGSPCINWCYGPGGWVVNSTGGLVGDEGHLDNALESPVIPWPGGGFDGATLAFDVYVHEPLLAYSPGIFYSWAVRSVGGTDPAAIENVPWESDNFVYYGGPDYRRSVYEVSAYLAEAPGFVQVRLQVRDLGYNWGWIYDDGTPAPYFDNVRLQAYALQGPVMSATEALLAHDAFPAAGPYDPADPGAASVRFDMSTAQGDSVVVQVVPARSGAVLPEAPRLRYRLHRNDEFDPWRSSGLPDDGSVACSQVMVGGLPVANRWCADLPDEGFLFPGDVLHYFFTATDEVGGVAGTSILPADTTGFGDFRHYWVYDERFTMRSLPTVGVDGSGPRRLLWFDNDDRADWDSWLGAFRLLCAAPGYEFDIFRTQDAATAANGLGSFASVEDLAGYGVIFYSAGDLGPNVWADGSESGMPHSEVQLVSDWLDLGDRGLYLGGDNFASGLDAQEGGAAFLANHCGLDVVAPDLRPYIGNQYAPRAVALPGTPVGGFASWLVDGACPDIRRFDAVVATATGWRLAEFAGPSGQTGYYPYAAMMHNANPVTGSACILTPYDLARVAADPYTGGGEAGLVRAALLQNLDQVLGMWYYPARLGCIGGVDDQGGGVPGARFGASASPNPFNPKVQIAYSVARPGPLTVRIFDLRGRLVRTVFEGEVETGGVVAWDGRDDHGGASASGVYFYEVRMDNDVEVGKLALIR